MKPPTYAAHVRRRESIKKGWPADVAPQGALGSAGHLLGQRRVESSDLVSTRSSFQILSRSLTFSTGGAAPPGPPASSPALETPSIVSPGSSAHSARPARQLRELTSKTGPKRDPFLEPFWIRFSLIFGSLFGAKIVSESDFFATFFKNVQSLKLLPAKHQSVLSPSNGHKLLL